MVVAGAVLALVSCAGAGSSEPITVPQLVERSADSPVAVQGLLHVSSGVARLCAATLESYPVQCGKPSVELAGLDLGAITGTTTAEDVTWKEGVVVNVERAGDDRYTVLSVAPADQP